jgi:geranylgeranyl pyrophosphate synthase
VTDRAPKVLDRSRPPQEIIPQTKAERDRILHAARAYAAEQRLVPPLSTHELYLHADAIMAELGVDAVYRKFVTVVIGTAVWWDGLARVPYGRRLLLLPQCLRDLEGCQAEIDEFGLICEHCGRCPIDQLQTEAERLGYVVLCAEGTAVVTTLFETGKIQAVIGVSCLSTLEKVYPYIEAAACPGVAIPLLNDGCANTSVDLDWVWDAVLLTSDDRTRSLDLDALRREVESWFTLRALRSVMGHPASRTEELAQEWLAKSGKRWRPFLAAGAYEALQDEPSEHLPRDLRKIAIAVECFHKASLIHDDIEDHDERRYGDKTLHEVYGIPIALNVGDLLLGEGYRMIAECGASDGLKARMLHAAATGHRVLSLGQGTELLWMREPRPMSPAEVLDIFRQKTAPAFEVALRLGLIYGGAEDLGDIISEYSEALGVAYQIRDDLNDFREEAAGTDGKAVSPSLLLAIAYERADGEAKGVLESIWHYPQGIRSMLDEVDRIFDELGVDDVARGLLESCKQRAIQAVCRLDSPSLKGLLRRVVSRIFDVRGLSRDAATGPASGRASGAQASG